MAVTEATGMGWGGTEDIWFRDTKLQLSWGLGGVWSTYSEALWYIAVSIVTNEVSDG